MTKQASHLNIFTEFSDKKASKSPDSLNKTNDHRLNKKLILRTMSDEIYRNSKRNLFSANKKTAFQGINIVKDFK